MTVFFNSNEIQLYRNRRINNTNRFAFSATYTALRADIQPASRERVEMVQGRFGAVWDCFMDPSVNIKEGDRAVDTATGKVYSVKAVNSWGGAGLLDHKEVVLVSQDA